MSVHYKTVKYCKVFHCDQRGDRFCCSTCRLARDCGNPCLNNPVRCKLEDVRRRVTEEDKA